MSLQNTLGRLLTALLVSQLIGCGSTAPYHVPEGAAQAGKPGNKQQWLCEAGTGRQWRCIDLSLARDAASSPKTTVANTPAAGEILKTPVVIDRFIVAPAPATDNKLASDPENYSDSNLDNYPDNYLVVQLIAAHSQQAIDVFVQQHPQLTLQQLTTIRDGQRWHHLILGPFPGYSAAQQAVAEIDPPLSTTPWIRPVAPLKAQLVSSTP